ncbi:MAG: 4Fe-4S dicluster domain-containing protein [Dehalococcoidia bacterium]
MQRQPPRSERLIDRQAGAPSTPAAVPRRTFLRRFAAAMALLGGGSIAPRFGDDGERGGDPPGPARHSQRQWAMVFDLRRCDGCERCADACSEMHFLPDDQPWLKVHELTDVAGQTYYQPQPCMQCERPPCVRVCPVGATYRTDDGVTLVDQDRCIGCRMCMAACPYDARTFNWDPPPDAPTSPAGPTPEFPVPQQLGTVGKCVFCVHDTRAGKLPACVLGCHTGAIYLGDFDSDVATNGEETVRLSTFLRDSDAFRLNEELGTHPRVYYIAGHGQHVDDDD